MAEENIIADEAPVRRKRRKRRSSPEDATLSINSLMDIVTIILVYLIKSYATSPIEVTDPSIALPTSISQGKIEEATVVMVTGKVRKIVDPKNPKNASFVKNDPWVVVDNTKVVQLDANTMRVPDADKDPDTGNYVIVKLRDQLKEAREIQDARSEVGGTEFDGKVVIIADKNTPYRVITDVLVTCGAAGFSQFRFAIIKERT